MKGYFITCDEEGDGLGFAIIAESLDEAKTIAYKAEEFSQCCDFKEITGWEVREGNISGLESGTVVGLIDGLERNIYNHISFEDHCPTCGQETLFLMFNQKTRECFCENESCPARPIDH